MNLSNNGSILKHSLLYKDDRQLLLQSDIKEQPYKYIGLLTFIANKGEVNESIGYATAFMITQSLVITNAHCIYDMDSKQLYKDIRFYPKASKKLKLFWNVINCKFNEQGFNNLNKNISRAFDYAILKLNNSEDIISEQNHLTLLANYQHTNLHVEVSGYPSDKIMIDRLGNIYAFQLTSSGPADSEGGHFANTYRGSSGSPLIVNYKQQKCAMGIHSGGHVSGEYNQGIYFNNQNIENIIKWCNQLTNGKEQPNVKVLKFQQDKFVEEDIEIVNGQLLRKQSKFQLFNNQKYELLSNQWDCELKNAKYYEFSQNNRKVEYTKPQDSRQIVAKYAVPLSGKYCYKLKITSKFGQTTWGVITENRRKQQKSGRRKVPQSIGYLNFGKDIDGKVWLMQNHQQGVQQKKVPYIDSEQVITFFFNMDAQLLHWFIGQHIATTKLSSSFQNKSLYIFASGRQKKDIFELV